MFLNLVLNSLDFVHPLSDTKRSLSYWHFFTLSYYVYGPERAHLAYSQRAPQIPAVYGGCSAHLLPCPTFLIPFVLFQVHGCILFIPRRVSPPQVASQTIHIHSMDTYHHPLTYHILRFTSLTHMCAYISNPNTLHSKTARIPTPQCRC